MGQSPSLSALQLFRRELLRRYILVRELCTRFEAILIKNLHTLLLNMPGFLWRLWVHFNNVFSFFEEPRQRLGDFFRWLALLMDGKESLRGVELVDVSARIVHLQQDVVAELALHSSNASVPSIAVQALAGLHVLPRKQHVIPSDLVHLLDDHFRQSFRENTLNHTFELRSNLDRNAVERYARAKILLPEQFTPFDRRRIDALTSTATNLNEAILLVCAPGLLEDTLPRASAKMLVEFVLQQPPVELARVHVWHYQLFTKAIRCRPTSLFTVNDDTFATRLKRELLERASPNKALTLQEELLIQALHHETFPTARNILDDNQSFLSAPDTLVRHIFASSIMYD